MLLVMRSLQHLSATSVRRYCTAHCQRQRLLDGKPHGAHLSSSFRRNVPCVARPVRLTMPVGCTMTCCKKCHFCTSALLYTYAIFVPPIHIIRSTLPKALAR